MYHISNEDKEQLIVNSHQVFSYDEDSRLLLKLLAAYVAQKTDLPHFHELMDADKIDRVAPQVVRYFIQNAQE